MFFSAYVYHLFKLTLYKTKINMIFMKILMFAGSLRKESFNKKILNAIMPFLKEQNVDVEFVDLVDLQIPILNEDDEKANGIPSGAQTLVKKIQESSALIISAPEYNGSISGVLKNTIDWVSRDKANVFQGKMIMLMSASPGYFGGVRGLWHTKVPLDKLEAQVYPEFFHLPSANKAFTPEGTWIDEKMKTQVEKILSHFLKHVQSFLK